jgi:pimeloyl-ACP methyl ester carboxylesterase
VGRAAEPRAARHRGFPGAAPAAGGTGTGAGLAEPGQLVWLGGLAAEVAGAGPTAILLHGNGEDARLWDGVRAELDGVRTVAVEARGHGRTPRGTGPMTIARLAHDLARALDQSGERGLMVGFSDGANVALELAVHRPDLVTGGLVVIGANLYPSGLKPGVWAGVMAGGVVRRALAPLSREARHRADVWSLMTGGPHIAPAALERVEAPTVVVAGDHDVISERHTRLIAEHLPRACLVLVPRAGHMLPLTHPALMARLITDALPA